MTLTGQFVYAGQRYQQTDKEIGELSRHWLRRRADRAAEHANARRSAPNISYRVVAHDDGRYYVLAFQNLVVS